METTGITLSLKRRKAMNSKYCQVNKFHMIFMISHGTKSHCLYGCAWVRHIKLQYKHHCFQVFQRKHRCFRHMKNDHLTEGSESVHMK